MLVKLHKSSVMPILACWMFREIVKMNGASSSARAKLISGLISRDLLSAKESSSEVILFSSIVKLLNRSRISLAEISLLDAGCRTICIVGRPVSTFSLISPIPGIVRKHSWLYPRFAGSDQLSENKNKNHQKINEFALKL